MSFAAPIAGLIAGLLGAAIVVLLYMLKLRRRPVAVSTTMLWRRAVRDMEGNIPWQAAKPSLLMILHLLIVALIALAIARPSIGSLTTDQRVVIVIDTSASMNAIAGRDGRTRLQAVKELAQDRVRAISRAAGTPEITVYRVGAEPRLVAGATRDTRRVLRAIGAIASTDQSGDLAAVFDQIRATLTQPTGSEELSEEDTSDRRSSSARVLVFSDGDSGEIPESIDGTRVELIVADSESLATIGIVTLSAERDRSTPALCRVFVRVQSTDSDAVGLVLRVLESGTELARKAIALDATIDGAVATKTATLEITLDRAAELEIVFDHDDALSADNRAWVRVPDPSPVRAVVVASDQGHPILLDVLSAISGRDPIVIDETAPIPEWAQLVVLDGVTTSEAIAVPSISFVGADERTAVEEIVSWRRSHAVLRDVEMGLVAFDSPRALSAENILASSDRTTAMIERASDGVRHIDVAFDLDRSNWPVQVGFTIFLASAVEYLVPGASGVGVVTTTDEQRPRVGVQEMRVDEGVQSVGVSLLSATESRVGAVDASKANAPESTDARTQGIGVDRPIWRVFVLAALVLMTIEWMLHANRIRV
jgi:hypothetical protein